MPNIIPTAPWGVASQLAVPRSSLSCSLEAGERAQAFICGRYTYANLFTRDAAILMLHSAGVFDGGVSLGDLKPRARKKAEAEILFMANVLKVLVDAEVFSITMNKATWTTRERACSYEVAQRVIHALLRSTFIVALDKGTPAKGRASLYHVAPSLQRLLMRCRSKLRFRRAGTGGVEVRKSKADWQGKIRSKERIPLARFPKAQVKHQRTQIALLNAHLNRFALRDEQGARQDTTLRRIFSDDFKHGGRLYAHAFQSLPERERLACTISGHPVCEVDLKASHVAFLAALCGHAGVLPRDPYSLIDWVAADPSLRPMSKVLVQVCVHADGTAPSSFPKAARNAVPFRTEYGLPKTARIQDYLPGIYGALPFLEASPRLTMTLQYLESEVILETLQQLARKRLPAFPVHDSLLVRQGDLDVATRALQLTLADHLGPHAPWLDVSYADGKVDDLKPLELPEGDTRRDHYKLSGLLERNGLQKVQGRGAHADDGDF